MEKFVRTLLVIYSLFLFACGNEVASSNEITISDSDDRRMSSEKWVDISSSQEKQENISGGIFSSEKFTSSSEEKVSLSAFSSSSRGESSSSGLSSSGEQFSSSARTRICPPEPNSLNLNEVFDNQKKALFPDTCEMQLKILVKASMINMELKMSILTAGPNKSIFTTKSSLVQYKTVKNNGCISVTNLKNGDRMPASDADSNPLDFAVMGTIEDYSGAVLEDSLWKIIPIDEKTPTLYYSTCDERIMKTFYVSDDSVTTLTYTYFDEFAEIPGAMESIRMERSVYLSDASMRDALKADSMDVLYDIKVLAAKQRHILPAKMFNIDGCPYNN